MASTFSPSLRLELVGDGDQSGIWGQTTNNNLGTLLEQAVAGVITINITDANYTLTNFNGVADEARNAVITITGTISQQRNIIAPLADKVFTFRNLTTGGFPIQVIGSSGTGVIIPNGATTSIYCDGTNFLPLNTGAAGNFSVSGNLSVAGTTTLTGALSGSTATFSGAANSTNSALSGTPTATTASSGDNTTRIATTAFVTGAVTAATGSLGTMSQQNSNNVTITGGTITGITDLAVADGGTGRSTLAANAVVLGNGTSGVNTVAPGSSGNLLVSNGTTWTAATLASSGVKLGLGITGEVWNNVTGSRSYNTQYTNSNTYPIMVSSSTTCSFGARIDTYINGARVVYFGWQFNGCGAFGGTVVIVPPGATYQLNAGEGVQNWVELY